MYLLRNSWVVGLLKFPLSTLGIGRPRNHVHCSGWLWLLDSDSVAVHLRIRIMFVGEHV